MDIDAALAKSGLSLQVIEIRMKKDVYTEFNNRVKTDMSMTTEGHIAEYLGIPIIVDNSIKPEIAYLVGLVQRI